MQPSMEVPEALGLAIRERRSELGLSAEDASASLGVEPGWLARVEDGAADLTLDVLLALAGALGTSLSDLFRRAEELARPPS